MHVFTLLVITHTLTLVLLECIIKFSRTRYDIFPFSWPCLGREGERSGDGTFRAIVMIAKNL